MSSRAHYNPISLDSEPDQPQPLESQSNNKQQKSASRDSEDEEDPSFTFHFDCEFYAPDKSQKSGFLRVNCTNCSVEWNSTCFDLELLKEKCVLAAVDDETGDSMTDALKESMLNKKNKGIWTAFISSNKSFPKAPKNRKAITKDRFQQWVEEAHTEYPRKSGFSYISPSPGKLKAKADYAARAKVVAAEAKRKQKQRALAQVPNGSDDVESQEPEDAKSNISSDSEKTAKKAFIKLLYEKYPTIGTYNDQYPAVIDPKDVTKYFALTFGKAKEWAELRHEDDVEVDSPPEHFKYDLIKKDEQASPPASAAPTLPTSTSNSLTPALFSEMLLGVVTAIGATRAPQSPGIQSTQSPWRPAPRDQIQTPIRRPAPDDQDQTPISSSRKHPISPEPSPPPSSSPPWADDPSDSTGTEGFLTFCRYSEEKTNKIRKIFKEADVTDYQLINAEYLSEEGLIQSGLSKMNILKLFQVATKYKSHLSRAWQAGKVGNNPSAT